MMATLQQSRQEMTERRRKRIGRRSHNETLVLLPLSIFLLLFLWTNFLHSADAFQLPYSLYRPSISTTVIVMRQQRQYQPQFDHNNNNHHHFPRRRGRLDWRRTPPTNLGSISSPPGLFSAATTRRKKRSSSLLQLQATISAPWSSAESRSSSSSSSRSVTNLTAIERKKKKKKNNDDDDEALSPLPHPIRTTVHDVVGDTDPVPATAAAAAAGAKQKDATTTAAAAAAAAAKKAISSSFRLFSYLGSKQQQVALFSALLFLSSWFLLLHRSATGHYALIRLWHGIHFFLRQHLAQIRYWTLRLAVVSWLTKSFLDWLTVKRRQAVDATSEWSRYASHPAARGRALMALIVPVSIQYMLLKSRILAAVLPRRWRQGWLRRSGQFLCAGLLQLGPLYIKLGQIVSCREHLLPAEWIAALEKLQDQVPAQTGKKAWELALSVWPKDGGDDDDDDSIATETNSSSSTTTTTTTTTTTESSSSFKSFHDTFADFDDVPLAAASLGQVHRAVLKETGDPVAIKLQRPFLREMYDQDFRLLTKFAASMDALSARLGSIGSRRKSHNSDNTASSSSSSVGSVGGIQQNWTSIFVDAEEILYREIDYRDEAENTVRFCKGFGLAKDGAASKEIAAKSRDGKPLPSAAPWLRAPYVYDDLSSEKALVMEFVPSIKITRTDKLREAGVTDEDREYLADSLARAYLRQFCCNYFFSTDPHAGNLGVEILDLNSTKPEDRVRLVFYDFGQAASLKPMQGEGILDIVEAIVDMDVDRSMESFEKMGVLKPNADLDKVRSKIADNFRTGKVKANRKRLKKRGYKFKDSSSNATSTTNTTSTATAGSDAEVMKFFTLPAEYAFVGRALSQMDGVGKVLDPEFDFISAAAPWIYEIKGATLYLQEEALKWLENTKKKMCKFLRMKRNPVTK